MAIDPVSLAITAAVTAINMAVTASKTIEGPRLKDTAATVADYGTPLNYFLGQRVLPCPSFFAKPIREAKKKRKGKGGKQVTYSGFGTWASHIADHEISGILKIWFDNHLVYDNTGSEEKVYPLGNDYELEGSVRFYLGGELQEPDPDMLAYVEARDGPGMCPAYRPTSYVYFENVPLEMIGNRFPAVSMLVEYFPNAEPVAVKYLAAVIVYADEQTEPGEIGPQGGNVLYTTVAPAIIAAQYPDLYALVTGTNYYPSVLDDPGFFPPSFFVDQDIDELEAGLLDPDNFNPPTGAGGWDLGNNKYFMTYVHSRWYADGGPSVDWAGGYWTVDAGSTPGPSADDMLAGFPTVQSVTTVPAPWDAGEVGAITHEGGRYWNIGDALLGVGTVSDPPPEPPGVGGSAVNYYVLHTQAWVTYIFLSTELPAAFPIVLDFENGEYTVGGQALALEAIFSNPPTVEAGVGLIVTGPPGTAGGENFGLVEAFNEVFAAGHTVIITCEIGEHFGSTGDGIRFGAALTNGGEEPDVKYFNYISNIDAGDGSAVAYNLFLGTIYSPGPMQTLTTSTTIKVAFTSIEGQMDVSAEGATADQHPGLEDFGDNMGVYLATDWQNYDTFPDANTVTIKRVEFIAPVAPGALPALSA